MLRLFIAVIVSEEIKKELLFSQKLQKKFGENLRWLAPQNLHLTLAFLGWIKEEKIVKIKDILRESKLKREGAEYRVLESILLSKKF